MARLAVLASLPLGLVAFGYPLLLPDRLRDAALSEGAIRTVDAPLLLLALLALIGLALRGEARAASGGGARQVALLGVLVAVNSALRLLPSLAGASPLFLLIGLVGYAYGRVYGFLMGALTLLVSALITGGVGPWLPFQMLGAGWMGLTAGWLPDLRHRPRAEVVALAAFGALWGLLYGAILNLWSWPFLAYPTGLGREPGLALAETAQRYAAFYLLTSLAYDLTRAAATAVLTLALGRPLLATLRRYQRRVRWQPVMFGGEAGAPATDPTA